jgi:L-tartrate/succinate antiporter
METASANEPGRIPASEQAAIKGRRWWRVAVPLAVAATIALFPAPAGCPRHAWHYFAIFAGVIAALVVEPLPGASIGLIGATLAAVLSRWVLFSPAELARPEFKPAASALEWALAGFSNSTIWLIFAAFLFALGYEKTGLGRRIALLLARALGRGTLTLGYAAVLTDAILAPFTPSNTARSAGTIFPLVRSLPPLYGSQPNTPSARKIGGYLMWTTFAATCVTSSLFLTACAPNLLAVEFARKIVNVDITWKQWFLASAPFALPLLLALPVLVYVVYPPQIRQGNEVADWAASELEKMGSLSKREIILSLLVLLAVTLWIFGGRYVEATTAALIVVSLMLVTGIVTWDEIARNHAAWTTLTMFATMVTLAGGLARTGFIKWFADNVAAQMGGLSPTIAILSLTSVYFFAHYIFASLTAHTTALLPVMLAVGAAVPGLPVDKLAISLALTTGIMGVITPYATGPSVAYYESGYLPAAHFWGLGAIFGLIFIGALLLLGVPLLMAR